MGCGDAGEEWAEAWGFWTEGGDGSVGGREGEGVEVEWGFRGFGCLGGTPRGGCRYVLLTPRGGSGKQFESRSAKLMGSSIVDDEELPLLPQARDISLCLDGSTLQGSTVAPRAAAHIVLVHCWYVAPRASLYSTRLRQRRADIQNTCKCTSTTGTPTSRGYPSRTTPPPSQSSTAVSHYHRIRTIKEYS